jgi:hypothetical protein
MKVFMEEQKFNLLLIIIIHSIAFFVIGITTHYNWSVNSTTSLSEKIGALSGLIFVALIAIMFLFMKLKTRIDENGIQYQFSPFRLKYELLTWEDISKVYLRKYDAISEYGGWGIKFSFFGRKSKSYTAKGNIGLQIELKNGNKVLIGTQKKDELQRAIDNYKSRIENITTI